MDFPDDVFTCLGRFAHMGLRRPQFSGKKTIKIATWNALKMSKKSIKINTKVPSKKQQQ